MESGLNIFVTKSYVKNPSKQGAKVKKPQTEEKAKGLIGLNKGKKISGAAYSVGNYKGKTLNLSKKDLGAAGRKAAANKVKIQDTNYDAASKKVMSGGKALTGKVDLGGGNMAVYKNGVRVRAAAKKAVSGGSGGGNGGGGGKNTAAAFKMTKRESDARSASKNIKPRVSTGYQAGKGQVSKTPIKTGTTKYTKKNLASSSSSNNPGSNYVWVPAVQKWVPKKGLDSTSKYAEYASRGGDATTAGRKVLAGTLAAAALYPATRVAAAPVKGLVGKVTSKFGGKGKAPTRPVPTNPAPIRPAGSKPVPSVGPKRSPEPPKATPPAAGPKIGTKQGVSKKTGGALKGGKPVTYGPKKPTPAQAAAAARSARAKKAAATRAANKAAAAKKKGKK